jgi:cytochrome c oxidase cbb3-type subunit 1
VHFWFATIGVLLYITAMWISGIMQGLMWRAFDEFGNLQYSFAESVAAMMPFYAMRAIGGALFLTGVLVMVYNMAMTIVAARREAAELEARLAAKMARMGA